MGFFDFFKTKNVPQQQTFDIDLSKSEYDNWLSFLDQGGSSEDWERLKKENKLVFPKDETELYIEYQKKLKPISDKYYKQLTEQIKPGWSQLLKSKEYTGALANNYEKLCIENIKLYLQMVKIEKKYNDYTSKSVPAYERLVMLYERQKNYDKAIDVCNEAIKNDASIETMKTKHDSLLNKTSKNIGNLVNIKENTKKKASSNPSKRQQLDPSLIDEAQKIEASKDYCEMVWDKYYSDYPEKPFISKDRELYSEWLKQAEMFPLSSIIQKKTMTRFDDGLLPGHIYMLHWIKNIHRKKVPSYFEYKYGICFEKEYDFLVDNRYIKNDLLTALGEKALTEHCEVVKEH